MLRYGKITEINAITGKGKIVDTNEQDICFEVSKMNALLFVEDQVRFRIMLIGERLQATGVKKNVSRLPKSFMDHNL